MIFTLLSGTATWITFIILYILNKKYTSFLTNYFFLSIVYVLVGLGILSLALGKFLATQNLTANLADNLFRKNRSSSEYIRRFYAAFLISFLQVSNHFFRKLIPTHIFSSSIFFPFSCFITHPTPTSKKGVSFRPNRPLCLKEQKIYYLSIIYYDDIF